MGEEEETEENQTGSQGTEASRDASSKPKKKKKESKTEIHQSVDVVIDDSVISRSNIGNIGGGGGDAQVQKQVLNKRTAGVKKRFCTNCGSPLPTSYRAKFCPECGAAVQ